MSAIGVAAVVGAGLGVLGAVTGYSAGQRGLAGEQQQAYLSMAEIQSMQKFSKLERAFELKREGEIKGSVLEQFGFGQESLANQGDLLELASLRSDIRQGFEENKLSQVSKAMGAKERIESARLASMGSRSAFGRSNKMLALSLGAPVEDQMAVAQNLGVVSRQEFAERREELDVATRKFSAEHERTLTRLGQESEFSAQRFEHTTTMLKHKYRQATAAAATAEAGQRTMDFDARDPLGLHRAIGMPGLSNISAPGAGKLSF